MRWQSGLKENCVHSVNALRQQGAVVQYHENILPGADNPQKQTF